MTRIELAATAMQGLLASWSEADEKRFAHMSNNERAAMIAEMAYLMADAMIERSLAG